MNAKLPTLQRRGDPLASPITQRRTLRSLPLAREFGDAIGADLMRVTTQVLQVNVGKLCNQTCHHCHVDAGPDRRESMSRDTFQACLDVLARTGIPTVDITGGAPELNPSFRWFVAEVRKLDRHVINRCNLTIVETQPGNDLPEFFAEHQVELIASLPHYRALHTDRQRGEGVFDKSIRALRKLNAVGYGRTATLHLVTNPAGAFLPAAQASLEREWKREMKRRHGIVFDSLYTITNMPISRYLEWLMRTGNLQGYMEKLVAAFNPGAAQGLMCRNTISIGWDGQVYDCDFNQMLELPITGLGHVRDLDLAALEATPVVTDRHCFGCTAGAGSSCGGATT